MNKDIKFRGKATMSIDELDEIGIKHDNGWVIGNFIQNGEYPYIVGSLVEAREEYISHEWWVSVTPKSIGQYTGLKDQDGEELYFNDYISVYFDKKYHSTTPIRTINDLCDLLQLVDNYKATFKIYSIQPDISSLSKEGVQQ